MSRWSRASWRGRAVLASVAIPPLVHLVSLNRLTDRLTSSPDRARPAESPRDDEFAAWVDRILKRLPWPWRWTCLKRSAVLYYLLDRAGRPAQLSIGVRRKPGDSLEAHAWLVRQGQIILEHGSPHVHSFEPIARFPELEP